MKHQQHSQLALILGAVAAGSVAMLAPAPAYADDITIDPTPFVSTLSRAQVRGDLTAATPAAPAGFSSDPWSTRYNQFMMPASQQTRADAIAVYKASRDMVWALGREDSGSFVLKGSTPSSLNPASMMGGPAR